MSAPSVVRKEELRKGDLRVVVAHADSPILTPTGWNLVREPEMLRVEPQGEKKWVCAFWRRSRTRYEPYPNLVAGSGGPVVWEEAVFRGVGSPPLVDDVGPMGDYSIYDQS